MRRVGSPMLPLVPVLVCMAAVGWQILRESNDLAERSRAPGPERTHIRRDTTGGAGATRPIAPAVDPSAPGPSADSPTAGASPAPTAPGAAAASPPAASTASAALRPGATGPEIHAWAVAAAKRGDPAELRRLLFADNAAADLPAAPSAEARAYLARLVPAAPGDPADWARLLDDLANRSEAPVVRRAAVHALRGLGGDAASTALARLARAESEPDLQEIAVEALGFQCDRVATAALADLARTPPPRLRPDAPDVQARAVAGLRHMLDWLPRQPRGRTPEGEAVRAAAVAGLAAMLDAPASEETRFVAVAALGGAATPGAHDELARRALDRATPFTVRDLALRALAANHAPQAVALARDVCLNDPSPALQIVARSVLLQYAPDAAPPPPEPPPDPRERLRRMAPTPGPSQAPR